ncbi:MAG: tetratricopeptide (TPR) repeat protein [Myxococcota bacterium]|jgi:tetratricopeptide (TPR) repeat protein
MLALLAVIATALASPFDACEVAVAHDAGDREGWRCFYMALRRGEADAAQITTALAAHDGPWPTLMRAHLATASHDDNAPTLFAEAIAGFEAADSPRGLARGHLGLSIWHGYRYDWPGAFAEIEAARVAAVRTDDPLLVATVKVEEARQRAKLAQYGLASALLDEAATVIDQSSDYYVQLIATHVRGQCAAAQGDPVGRIDAYQRTLEITEAAGDWYGASVSALNLGEVLATSPEHRAGRPSVVSLGEKARLYAQRGNNPSSLAGAECVIGRGQGREGREAFLRCAEAYEALGDKLWQGRALVNLAMLDADTDPDGALRWLREALGGYSAENQDEMLFAEAFVAWRSGTAPAAETTERLLGHLTEYYASYEEDADAPYVVDWFAELHDMVAAPWLDLPKEGGEQRDPAHLDMALHATEAHRAVSLRRRLDAMEDTRLSALQSALEPGQVVLIYQLSALDEDVRWLHPELVVPSWVMHVSADDAVAVGLGDARDIEDAVDAWLGALGDEAAEPVATQALHARLLGSVLPPDIRELIIVPDGALWAVPFAALVPALTVTYAPSATAWLALGDLPQTVGTPLSVAAAQGAVPEDPVWTALADLPRLTAADGEARAVSDRMGGDLVIDATEESLKRQAPGRSLLHVAAHAVSNPAMQERSALILAGPPGSSGLMERAEIEALPLDGSVVVLSACSSAAGETVRGEGVLGITRAFLRAGSRAVVGNLWPVRDQPAADFFAALYPELAAGAPIAEALQRAQESRRSAGAPTRDWAGFVVQGDGAARVPSLARPPRLPWLLGLLGVLVGIAGVFAQLRSRRDRAI